ncbi:Alpha/Beta hydrolase protein [Aspergillus karnatakaensis]|uniref:alpha/beta hydrolase n=1 Tax=Aspergillus karnatakaensis TaxID=1810916 RepID=UPI003CCD770B
MTLATAHPSGPSSFDTTKLSYHPAPTNNGLGVTVLVVPGGGYSHVSLDREGTNSTTYLNARGYDAWVLNYSVAETAPTPLYPVPIDEALGAVRYIRKQQKDKGQKAKLGIWGYSAGGHLAAITVTNPAADLDFGILTYPVISMDSAITHAGSRSNLLGSNPSPKLVEKMSAEKQVTNSTPPIFVYHSANDAAVPVENTLRFIGALTEKSVPFQALILPDGEHGIALALDDPVRYWGNELERFLTYSI